MHVSRLVLAVVALAVLASGIAVAVVAYSPQKPQSWTLSGAGFAGGTFQNVTLAGGSLQLAARPTSLGRTLVLQPGPPGTPDSDALFSASVLHDTDGVYKMYYTGLAGNLYTVMLATSSDGVTFVKRGAVLPATASNAVPFVLKVGSVYHMFYEIVAPGGPWGWCDEIYAATSLDGLAFTPQGRVLSLGPAGSWDGASVSDPHVVLAADGTYRMYYTGTEVGHDAEIGLAISTDLVTWVRYGGDPVLTFGAPGAWDNAHVASPSVVRDGSDWTMYYYAFPNYSVASIGRATSADGITWFKDPANPWITPEAGPAWDDTSVAFPDFSVDSAGVHLYYRGSNATTSSIGLYSFVPADDAAGRYESPVFNTGQSSSRWISLGANASVPSGTTMVLLMRVGKTASPDATWSGWAAAGNVSSLPRSRYVQVAVVLTSAAGSGSPVVVSVTLVYMPGSGGS